MPSDRQIVAFKIGARARKLATEDCMVEGFEMLLTAKAEADMADTELAELLQRELDRFEQRFMGATTP